MCLIVERIRGLVQHARAARSGQVMVIFTLAITGLMGMAALGVDLGHAIERRQFIQGVANDTARAGAFEADSQAQSTALKSDAAVVRRMVDTLAQNGLSVPFPYFDPSTNLLNDNLGAQVNWSACAAGLSPNQVLLEAYYIDVANRQIGRVGSGNLVPAATSGVQVTHVSMCVPSFFARVIGRPTFDVGAGDLAGQSQAVEGFNSPPGQPVPVGIAPFYIYGHPCYVRTLTTCTDDSNDAKSPYSLFAIGAPQAPGCLAGGDCRQPGGNDFPPSSTYPNIGFSCPDTTSGHGIPCDGDLVTLHNLNNAGSKLLAEWDYHQFMNWDQGVHNDPTYNNFINGKRNGGFQAHDGSNRGCLDPFQTGLQVGGWAFDHGGGGPPHCDPPPTLYSTVEIPVVDEVCKVGSCNPGDTIFAPPPGINCPKNSDGGYCVHIVGFVAVYIATQSGGVGGNETQGYIVKVLEDPYCIVQAKSGEHLATDAGGVDLNTLTPPTLYPTTCP